MGKLAHYLDDGTRAASPEAMALTRRFFGVAFDPVDPIHAIGLQGFAEAIASAAEHGRRLGLAEARGQRACRVCGCTELQACVDPPHGACAWAGPDLCTACQPYVTPIEQVRG